MMDYKLASENQWKANSNFCTSFDKILIGKILFSHGGKYKDDLCSRMLRHVMW